MINEVDIFVHVHPWAFSLGCLIFGTILGAQINFWRALQLARRKEFNDVADPTRTSLRREIKDLRANAQWVKGDDLALLIDMAHFYNRPRLRNAVKAYQNARQQHIDVGSLGERFFTRTDHVERATRKLLSHLERRF